MLIVYLSCLRNTLHFQDIQSSCVVYFMYSTNKYTSAIDCHLYPSANCHASNGLPTPTITSKFIQIIMVYLQDGFFGDAGRMKGVQHVILLSQVSLTLVLYSSYMLDVATNPLTNSLCHCKVAVGCL